MERYEEVGMKGRTLLSSVPSLNSTHRLPHPRSRFKTFQPFFIALQTGGRKGQGENRRCKEL
jgi:hypothetical protein